MFQSTARVVLILTLPFLYPATERGRSGRCVSLLKLQMLSESFSVPIASSLCSHWNFRAIASMLPVSACGQQHVAASVKTDCNPCSIVLSHALAQEVV